MEREELQTTIIALCQDLGMSVNLDDIDDEAKGALSLAKDLDLDTLDVVELMLGLQEATEVLFQEEDFFDCETIEEVCDYALSIIIPKD